ncbi:M23 family metallopeptidase [Sinimarinibacterium sp. CAU 1509]|uniref:M23 family metallopeptidase n=1 Tax=Sinimarinibacterium sp. CAU 1509 TaxID=2562283 RepID=UPI0010AD3672|nr:M23 family metallopeptidase [Sinimarinibacterium sp. CAU 1509]TJY56603.1 M23 family metallopeptidase [Sinimarinibacterium sp. CAU 1509]
MNARVVFAALCCAWGFWASSAQAEDLAQSSLQMAGQWTQGGVIVGQAMPGTAVWLDGKALRLTDDGRFVLGLDRDAPASVELKVQLPGAAPTILKQAVSPRDYQIQRIDGLPQNMVSPPAKVLQRIREDQKLVAAARARDTDIDAFSEAFLWPCQGRISGVFGSQRILNGQPKQPHYGVDVAVPVGTKVYAPAGGIVSLAHPDMYYTGATLMIDHGHGLSSALLHLSKLLVSVGQEVKQGDLIALSGVSGRATGPHLDWRVNWFDARVDAALLVPPMTSAQAQ